MTHVEQRPTHVPPASPRRHRNKARRRTHTYDITTLIVDGEPVALRSAALFANRKDEWEVVAIVDRIRPARLLARVGAVLSDGRSFRANVQEGHHDKASVAFLGISSLPESIAGELDSAT